MAIQIFERQNPYPQIMSELYRIASARNTAKEEMRMRGEEAAAQRKFQAAENLAARTFQEGRDKINAQLQVDIATLGKEQAIALAQERTAQLKNHTDAMVKQSELDRELRLAEFKAKYGGYEDVPMGPPSPGGTMGTSREWVPGLEERLMNKRQELIGSLVQMATPKVAPTTDPKNAEVNIPPHIMKAFSDAGIDMPQTVMAGDLPYYIDQLEPDALDYLGASIPAIGGALAGGAGGLFLGGPVGAVAGAGVGAGAATAFIPTDLSQKRAIKEGPIAPRLSEVARIAAESEKRRGDEFIEAQRLNAIASLLPYAMQ